ncbi:tyrosine decarboxylase 1-like [Gossypium australe]|uniref:Tyrosine decarboxylase 1-like n=1 Tax=Gossypium australe TaxID=47621 RepID=A0A5B6WDT9_9ROSI|nr:tyrosine decarboxylase 1-like [Gossypium australe]
MRPLPPNRFSQLASTDIDFLGRVWDTVGPTVCDWVKMVFNGGDIDSGLNNTLIVFIPKIQNPEEFAQFCPISL